jgi:hypothetical protein
MYLGEIGWGVVDWIDLSQHRAQWRALVSRVMNLRFLRVENNFATMT